MLSPDTDITIFPDWVEYRTLTAHGTQVIRVFLNLYVPRVLCFVEWVGADGRRVREPMSVPLDEAISYSIHAAQAANRPLACLDMLHQALTLYSSER